MQFWRDGHVFPACMPQTLVFTIYSYITCIRLSSSLSNLLPWPLSFVPKAIYENQTDQIRCTWVWNIGVVCASRSTKLKICSQRRPRKHEPLSTIMTAGLTHTAPLTFPCAAALIRRCCCRHLSHGWFFCRLKSSKFFWEASALVSSCSRLAE